MRRNGSATSACTANPRISLGNGTGAVAEPSGEVDDPSAAAVEGLPPAGEEQRMEWKERGLLSQSELSGSSSSGDSMGDDDGKVSAAQGRSEGNAVTASVARDISSLC